MEKHPKQIEKYSGSLKELAEEIGNLHYESLAEFLQLLSSKLDRDADNDAIAGRFKLANELSEAKCYIKDASKKIESAWLISKPYMK